MEGRQTMSEVSEGSFEIRPASFYRWKEVGESLVQIEFSYFLQHKFLRFKSLW